MWEAKARAAAVQQLRRRCDEAAELAVRAYRNVEGCEAARPLRELNPMGEEIRDAVVFLFVTSSLHEIDVSVLKDGMPFSSCAPPP